MGSTLENDIFAPIARQADGPHEAIFKTHKASFRDFAAHTVTHDAIKLVLGRAPNFPPIPGPVLPTSAVSPTSAPSDPAVASDPDVASDAATTEKKSLGKIGIIGAGVCGLYTAMILQDLGIQYEILEANPDRIGGRLFTHRFNGNVGLDAAVGTPARYDYFDVGAMRFPQIPFMDRVFDLFNNRIGINGLLAQYTLTGNNDRMYYNTRPPVTRVQAADIEDYFRVSQVNQGTVPEDYANVPAEFWMGQIFDFYKNAFAAIDNPVLTPAERGDVFRQAFMRAGLNNVAAFPESVIEWLEMFQSGTGLFDDAFVGAVMGSLDFGWPWPLQDNGLPPDDTEWFCIDGGSDHIARQMTAVLDNQPELGRRVTRIAEGANGIMEVTLAGVAAPRPYSQVISTVPLGCLGAIDTEGCDLLYIQKQAVRALKAGASTKIGIRFPQRWWQDQNIMGAATLVGGQSSTDLPIRTCVYPSYGVNVPNAPGVLLASYTWSLDALRIGGAIQPADDDNVLVENVLSNLEKLHGIPRANFGPVIDHFAHSWSSDINARGAFGGFGPGQFGHPGEEHSMFASLKAPSPNGKFHIAGEPTSVHHGWVLGALNSAWRAVYNALDGHPALRAQLINQWGIPDEDSEVQLQMLIMLSNARLL